MTTKPRSLSVFYEWNCYGTSLSRSCMLQLLIFKLQNLQYGTKILIRNAGRKLIEIICYVAGDIQCQYFICLEIAGHQQIMICSLFVVIGFQFCGIVSVLNMLTLARALYIIPAITTQLVKAGIINKAKYTLKGLAVGMGQSCPQVDKNRGQEISKQ